MERKRACLGIKATTFEMEMNQQSRSQSAIVALSGSNVSVKVQRWLQAAAIGNRVARAWIHIFFLILFVSLYVKGLAW